MGAFDLTAYAICMTCSARTPARTSPITKGQDTDDVSAELDQAVECDAIALGWVKLRKVREEHRVRHAGYVCRACAEDVARELAEQKAHEELRAQAGTRASSNDGNDTKNGGA